MIYLRFSTEKWSLASALIRWRTESKVSHVELYDDITLLSLGARFSLLGKMGIDPGDYPDGVALRNDFSYWLTNVILIPVPWAQDAWNWIKANEYAKPYDWRGIWGIVNSWGAADPGACFCSELIVRYLQATAQWPWNLSAQATTPRDLLVMFTPRDVIAKNSLESRKERDMKEADIAAMIIRDVCSLQGHKYIPTRESISGDGRWVSMLVCTQCGLPTRPPKE